MKRPVRVFAVGALLASLMAGALIAQPPTCTKPPFSLTISGARSTNVIRFQGMWLHVVLTNISDRTIGIVDRSPELDYDVAVLNSDGTPALDTERGRAVRDRWFRSSFVAHHQAALGIEPNKTDSEDISIDDLYEVSHPGQYTIQVQRETSKELGGCIVRSNIIRLTVTD